MLPAETTFTRSTSSPCRAAIAGTPPARRKAHDRLRCQASTSAPTAKARPQPPLRWPQRAGVKVGDEKPPVRREHDLADNAHVAA
jgi:hypothetical protein